MRRTLLHLALTLLLLAAPTAALASPQTEESAHRVGAAATTATAGDTDTYSYTIESRGAVASDLSTFAAEVADTLGDPRGWWRAGILFRRVAAGGDVRIILASPSEVAAAHPVCSPQWSCRVGDQVLINDDRWRYDTEAWDASLGAYRNYVVNHETGHWLGLGHASCPGAGQDAPVMQQQSISLEGCDENGWPLQREIERVAALHGTTVVPRERPWNGWDVLAAGAATPAGAASWGPGRRDVFAVGPDGTLVHKWYDGEWGPAGVQDLGAPPGLELVGAPSAVSRSPGQLNVVARGSDDALWHRWYAPSTGWSAWESLGGVLTSAPGAVSWSSSHLSVFARGRDGRVWHLPYEAGWRGWRPVGGVATSAPAAASLGPGLVDLVVRGRDGALWHREHSPRTGWSAWQSLGGTLAGDGRPAIIRNGPDRLDTFVIGTNGALYHRWHLSGRGWQPDGFAKLGTPAGLTLESGTAALSLQPRRAEVYVMASDGNVWHHWQR